MRALLHVVLDDGGARARYGLDETRGCAIWFAPTAVDTFRMTKGVFTLPVTLRYRPS